MNAFAPGPRDRTVCDAEGNVLTVPEGWILVPPGDAALTRRLKAAGEYMQVQEKKRRRTFSLGLWAPETTVRTIEQALEAERSTEGYARKRQADQRRRNEKQTQYVEDFRQAVVEFLDFHADYSEMAERMADRVASHATPVGSGTVARTQRISIERRAEAAVIAWMRHQTTAYDRMKIARVRGERHEVRRMLAQRSRELLDGYRQGIAVGKSCPLQRALLKDAEQEET